MDVSAWRCVRNKQRTTRDLMVQTRRQMTRRPNGIGSSNTGGGIETAGNKRSTGNGRAGGKCSIGNDHGEKMGVTQFHVTSASHSWCADWAGPETGHIWVHLWAGRNLRGPTVGFTGKSSACGYWTSFNEVNVDPQASANVVGKTAKGYTTSSLHGFVVCCSQLVTIRTSILTSKMSTFCPHSVFVRFVWIWEQTAIISLYSINWMVCITETECVYCAVRTGSLYIILRSAHTVYLCVLCGSENKQRFSLYTALTYRFFITEAESVFCAVRTGSLN